MYRKRFDPQRPSLPNDYCGWAADVPKEAEKTECKARQIPEAVQRKKELVCAISHPSELSDIILIGGVILLICTLSSDRKPDLSLLIPLILLLVKKPPNAQQA